MPKGQGLGGDARSRALIEQSMRFAVQLGAGDSFFMAVCMGNDLANFVGTNDYDNITPSWVSSSVTADPAGSRPGADSDTIRGLGGDDQIGSGGGNDFIYGGAGNDTVNGGDGDDFFDDYTDASYGGSDTFSGGAGADTAYGYTGSDRLYGEDGADKLYGEEDNDTLDGGAGADQLYGGAGSDTYYVDNAGDVVEDEGGDSGGYNDSVLASVSFTLGSFIESLTLVGRGAIDGTGNGIGNSLTGNDAANVLRGLGGNDTLQAGRGSDRLEGGDGSDALYAGDGDDALDGGEGNDSLIGGEGKDALTGGGGSDSLSGGEGEDTFRGGAGDDTYSIEVGEDVREDAGGGIDTINVSATWTLSGNFENLSLGWGSEAYDGTGTDDVNVLSGNYGSNTLRALGGNDTLFGNGGSDSLYGGTGADTMEGGEGNDIYYVDDTGDRCIEYAYDWFDSGYDIIYSAIGMVVPDGIESLRMVPGSGPANVTGNGLDNVLWGTSDRNIMRGMDGDDTIDTGNGVDTIVGGRGNDTFLFLAAIVSNPSVRDEIRRGNGAIAFEGAGDDEGDHIDLSRFDADLNATGEQRFVFGTERGIGRLWAENVGRDTYIRGNIDGDVDAEFELRIIDRGIRAAAYSDEDFLV